MAQWGRGDGKKTGGRGEREKEEEQEEEEHEKEQKKKREGYRSLCPQPPRAPRASHPLHPSGGDSAAEMELLQQRAQGRTNFSRRCTSARKVIIVVTVLTVVLLLIVAIITLAAKKDPPCPAPTLPSCLESGIGFGNKCFYFLEEEVDWEGSQHSCLSRQAHLATIDTKEELV
ncbi:C-type lectin domain family 2 member D-related protein-like isoform X4 [Passer montanus]|nr:C-type lectin domain family 2 member D-related protein-like isoform X4 [Passer montanus]